MTELRRGSVTADGAGRRFGQALRPRVKVLPEHAREHNRALVLQTLFDGAPMSRADLARVTGLTRVTISDLVGELIGAGLVVEKGLREHTRPGKPALLVDLARDAHQILAIDLSRPDELAGAVLTLDGDVVQRLTAARPAAVDGDATLAAVIAFARELQALATAPLLGLGVGTPGVVTADGVILRAPNVGWNSMPLQDTLGRALDLPVVVRNDANAAVLAEHTFGGSDDDTMVIRIGLGVGSGLLAGGVPMLGSHFAAGEIGHVTVGTDGGPTCACGKIGCLEAWLSVPALQRRIAAEGDRDLVLREAGERLGIALAPVVGALDLSVVVLSGPPDLLAGTLIDAVLATLRTRTLAEFHDDVQVTMTDQGDDIVLRGAAVMVLSTRLGVS